MLVDHYSCSYILTTVQCACVCYQLVLPNFLCTLLFSFTGQCPELPPITNGAISYFADMMVPFNQGTVATYTCNGGFVLIGIPTRLCGGGGVWFGVAPECRRKKQILELILKYCKVCFEIPQMPNHVELPKQFHIIILSLTTFSYWSVNSLAIVSACGSSGTSNIRLHAA